MDKRLYEESIILIGPSGAGKSTTAEELCKKTNMKRLCLDRIANRARNTGFKRKFRNADEFNYYMISEVLRKVKDENLYGIVDFGAGHSIYEDLFMFLEMKHLIEQFSHVILLMPSEEKEESLSILNEQKGIEEGSQRAKDNAHFVYSSCNEKLATLIQYTKGKNPSEITDELLTKLEEKTKISTI